MKQETPEQLSKRLASALWQQSKLRHGLFTTQEFRDLCEAALLEELGNGSPLTEPR